MKAQASRPFWSKIAWFISLWGAGVATVLLVAAILRWWLSAL
jgi:hypothetical protein